MVRKKQIIIKTYSFVLVVLLLVFTGCKAQTSDQIVGIYCLNSRQNRDSLFLYNDRTYLYKYHSTTKKNYSLSGEWSYDSIRMRVSLKQFSFFSDSGIIEYMGKWSPRVKNVKGELRLMYSEENNVYFYKTLK